MQTIDTKFDCIGSRKTCRYWKKGRKKKKLGNLCTRPSPNDGLWAVYKW